MRSSSSSFLQSLANVLQPFKQQAVGPPVAAKTVGKLPIEITRRQPHPVQRMRGLLGWTEAGRQIKPRLGDLGLRRQQSSSLAGRSQQVQVLNPVRLNSNQQRRANEVPSQAVAKGQCLVGNGTRKLADQGQRRIRYDPNTGSSSVCRRARRLHPRETCEWPLRIFFRANSASTRGPIPGGDKMVVLGGHFICA